jgi:hypothetical protein|tara:strand:+ start:295 stop:687 length:393 start_codon:yes stop_codon:yes gene_type:complete
MAITTSLTWEITNVDRDLSDGFITSANWKITGICTVTSGSASTTYGPVDHEGVLSFNTSRTGSEIPYANVTQDNVISWVQNGFIGVTTIGEGSDAITTTGIELEKSVVTDHLYVLYTKKPPTSGSGTPWS